MSIIAAYNEAWDNADADALSKLIHDDCVFNPHVGGITMSKSDILGFVSGGSTPKAEQQRNNPSPPKTRGEDCAEDAPLTKLSERGSWKTCFARIIL